MAVTIKCPDCGHTEKSEDGESKTCPECEGTMTAPPKKKSKRRDDDEDEEDEPKAKKKRRDDDREDEDENEKDAKPAKKSGSRGGKNDGDGPVRDGKAAADLDINPGFKNKPLMSQVEEELEYKEVLHWAGRQCPEFVKRSGMMTRIFGFIFAGAGLLFCVIVLAVVPGMMKLMVLFPLLFVLIGLGLAVFMPGIMAKQAA